MKSSKKPSSKAVKDNGDSSTSDKDVLQVFCRLRPTNSYVCMEVLSPTVLSVHVPETSVYYQSVGKEKHFTFKQIFGLQATQQEVFKCIGEPLVKGLLKGQNGLLFAYGVTGSGKTYTMTGNKNTAGIMTRCVQTLFKTIEHNQADKYIFKPDKFNCFDVQTEQDAKNDRMKEAKRFAKSPPLESNLPSLSESELDSLTELNENKIYAVFVTYVEIYNNSVYDLLDEQKTAQSKIIREDCNHNMYVHGVTEVEVKSPSEAMLLFEKGKTRRHVSYTHLNAESSRSHSIFTVRLVQAPRGVGETGKHEIIISQLSLVDLAGSERSAKTVSGVQLKEATNINSSLLNLRLCLYILSENFKSGENNPVPYRDSKLTHLFKMYFERGGLVRMLVCVNPSVQQFDESFCVLKFAQLSSEIQVIKPEQQKMNVEVIPKPPPAKQMRMLKQCQHKYSCCCFKTPQPATPFAKPAVARSRQIKLESSDECVSTSSVPSTPSAPSAPPLPTKSEPVYDHSKSLLKLFESLEELKELPRCEISSFDDVDKLTALRNHLEQRIKIRAKIMEQLKVCSKEFHDHCQVADDDRASSDLELKVLRETLRACQQKCEKFEKENEAFNSVQQQNHQRIYNMQTIINDQMTVIEQQKLEIEQQRIGYERKMKKQKEMFMLALSKARGEKRKRELDLDLDFDDDPPTTSSNKRRSDRSRTSTSPYSTSRESRPTTTPSSRRRSKSVETAGVVIEHLSGIAADPFKRTVLQPHHVHQVKKVFELKATDLRKPVSQYCLVRQELDTDGEIETQVIRGDVTPTFKGGAQVVFEDVEVLRRRSPSKLRHRSCPP